MFDRHHVLEQQIVGEQAISVWDLLVRLALAAAAVCAWASLAAQGG